MASAATRHHHHPGADNRRRQPATNTNSHVPLHLHVDVIMGPLPSHPPPLPLLRPRLRYCHSLPAPSPCAFGARSGGAWQRRESHRRAVARGHSGTLYHDGRGLVAGKSGGNEQASGDAHKQVRSPVGKEHDEVHQFQGLGGWVPGVCSGVYRVSCK